MLMVFGLDPDLVQSEIKMAEAEQKRIESEFETVIVKGFKQKWTEFTQIYLESLQT